jgi:pilus assembly protein CpaB
MNTQRLIVLGIAFVAAGGAAFMARGLLGGGTPNAAALPGPQVPMSDVLVAGSALQPGQELTASDVRWQKWPTAAVDHDFITHAAMPDLETGLSGTVLRAPLIAGQPLSSSELVHANAAGFMAAMLNPGMRAVSIPITTEAGAGGFILPNDRVDIIMTRKANDNSGTVLVKTVLRNIRVLAVDQTFKQDKGQKDLPSAKSATLELAPRQAETVAKAQAEGVLSLALRALGDDSASAVAANRASMTADSGPGDAAGVSIIRYGVGHSDTSQGDRAQ